jgi:ubiquinone/menaquinone biosynthesis C-methylase UbiE
MTDEKKSTNDNQYSIPEVYDLIAESFDSKRRHPWKEVVHFIDQLRPSERVLDLGCGNARHSRVLLERDFEVVGLDISYKILQTAKNNELISVKDKLVSLVNGDAKLLPFKKNSFNSIIMIAVFHHFEGLEDRDLVLQEIKRIMASKGKCLISVWLKSHPRFEKEDLREIVRGGRKDIIVPWTLPDGKKIKRYYYLFDKDELESLVSTIGFKILKSEISNHNLFLTIQNE